MKKLILIIFIYFLFNLSYLDYVYCYQSTLIAHKITHHKCEIKLIANYFVIKTQSKGKNFNKTLKHNEH